MIASRFADPYRNINFVFADPFLHRQWGPGPIHVAVTLLVLAIAIYLPTHVVLARIFRVPAKHA
jgi:hypothetical protein